MNREVRRFLQITLLLLSCLVACVGTVMWYRIHTSGGTTPIWLLGMIGYGWMFIAFFALDRVSHRFSRKRYERYTNRLRPPTDQ